MSQLAVRGVVPVTYVQLLYEYLGTQGIEAAALLGEPQPVAANGLGRYPVQQWQQHLNTACKALNDPLLGLHLGATITPKHLGMLGYVLLSCGTLGAALERLLHYYRLIYDVNPMQMRLLDEQVELRWGEEQGRPGPLVDETAIAALVQFCRDICDSPELSPDAIGFINAIPNELEPYTNFFGCGVAFNEPVTRVVWPLRCLDIPLRAADPALGVLLEKQADALLASCTADDACELLQKVRQAIGRHLHEGLVSAEWMAAQLHMSSRNLHRKLTELGSSFSELMQQTRTQLAKHYLSDERLQLAEIAQLLGYSEQSAFSRGFKQSVGLTPLQYRRQQR